MKLTCLSDIHGQFKGLKIPKADILILAGDVTKNFSYNKQADANVQLIWMKDELVPFLRTTRNFFDHIVIVPGNHDKAFELNTYDAISICKQIKNVHVLIDEEICIDGKKFYGSPWTPWFHGDYWCFQLPQDDHKGSKAKETWDKIPLGLDVLITHGPPFGILDKTADGRNVGCPHLLLEVQTKKPKVHLYGHIHEAYGSQKFGDTQFYNVSTCTLQYQPTNPPVVIEI